MHQEWSQGPATEPPRATVPKGCGFTEAKPGETKEPDNNRQTTITFKDNVDFFILFLK